jgi:hypothetical protein
LSADRTVAAPSPVTPGNGSSQVDYNVRDPVGGLRHVVEAFLADSRIPSIDLNLSTGRGEFATVRVFPDRDMIVRNATTPDLVFFHSGICYVVKDGEETGRAFACSGHINLEVTIAKSTAGTFGILHNEGETL